jgi:hypothetical protein
MKDRKPGSGPQIEETTCSAPNMPSAKLGRDIQVKIGQQLRTMYDDVVKQGVPDRFIELLNQLDTSDHKGKR